MADALVGTWSLVEFRVELGGDKVAYPFGKDGQGRLMYTPDGYMSATLQARQRPALQVERLESYHRASAAEKATAFDSSMSYTGRYTYNGQHVHHHVELSSVPNIIGLEQVRRVEWEGDTLVLSYRVASSRGERRNVLRWRRER